MKVKLNDPIGWTRIVAPLWNDMKPKRYTFHSWQIYRAFEWSMAEHLSEIGRLVPGCMEGHGTFVLSKSPSIVDTYIGTHHSKEYHIERMKLKDLI